MADEEAWWDHLPERRATALAIVQLWELCVDYILAL
jgi:hypothetical protein